MPEKYMLLRDNEVKGVAALRAVADELFNGIRPSSKSASGMLEESDYANPDTVEIDDLWLPVKQTRALFFTGKGGVGKTTVSCVAALYLSDKGYKTLLVTTDPAAHIGEVLDIKIGSEPTRITDELDGVMIDQVEATKQYKKKILDDARGKYSDDMLAAMEEELNSPCTEEMAAFERFAQFIENDDYEVIVFDTAPTGHTLRLLDLPFDYAKQVEMMIDADECKDEKEETEDRFKDIIEMLRDPKRTVFNLVLYPESTPIMESYRTMLDLKEAGIETQLVIANMVLPEEVSTNSFFKSRRRMQMKYLTEIHDRFGLPVMQMPLAQDEVKGIADLTDLGAKIRGLSV